MRAKAIDYSPYVEQILGNKVIKDNSITESEMSINLTEDGNEAVIKFGAGTVLTIIDNVRMQITDSIVVNREMMLIDNSARFDIYNKIIQIDKVIEKFDKEIEGIGDSLTYYVFKFKTIPEHLMVFDPRMKYPVYDIEISRPNNLEEKYGYKIYAYLSPLFYERVLCADVTNGFDTYALAVASSQLHLDTIQNSPINTIGYSKYILKDEDIFAITSIKSDGVEFTSITNPEHKYTQSFPRILDENFTMFDQFTYLYDLAEKKYIDIKDDDENAKNEIEKIEKIRGMYIEKGIEKEINEINSIKSEDIDEALVDKVHGYIHDIGDFLETMISTFDLNRDNIHPSLEEKMIESVVIHPAITDERTGETHRLIELFDKSLFYNAWRAQINADNIMNSFAGYHHSHDHVHEDEELDMMPVEVE